MAEGTYEEMCLPLNTTSNPNMEGTTLVLVVVVSEWVGRGVAASMGVIFRHRTSTTIFQTQMHESSVVRLLRPVIPQHGF